MLVLFTLIIASNILTEAGLSFLGAGVQPPNPSWGTLIADGQTRIVTAPWLAIIPGIVIVLTVLSLNVFGDGLRDALDPRAKVRIERCMITFLVSRLFGALLVLVAVSFITYADLHQDSRRRSRASASPAERRPTQNIQDIREKLHLDDPFYVAVLGDDADRSSRAA